uniref:Uncharacterized protein n=1 Tax=Leersia perrieri TaxID=77586 RepID=A0A0D9V306_9ORYZ
MALSSSRPRHHLLLRPLLRGLHSTTSAMARLEQHEFSKMSNYGEPGDSREVWARLERLRKGYTRDAFEQDFRQALMKERAEKLESWWEKEKLRAQKKADGRELLRKKSSMRVAESKRESTIMEAIRNTTAL